ncbi:hypothetical protein HKBW3S44_01392 [Candidatus Hakubella thermalkaliphila]|uniref:Uncharacterized protein n=1 Tax=Candidatus Hakubella thermalkaliphila TaxID=2754717 RepID=A0A6V8PFF1_9ACTN|nr:hypothetical protein HKBW3S09_01489 [Candidatus Hakubella thermalkaliphila]GFP31063.1 hypothetical protein HKBW3S34_01982 [Candidatus Hakubella thermalkaliphila]GFP37715.1 hypothetical protein HKBW3S44_01392 [Candidatus Hakubella thermalkaliphila]
MGKMPLVFGHPLKLSLIADFAQKLTNLTKTVESIDSWLEIVANLMREK